MTLLEDSKNRVGETKVNVGDCQKTQEDQNQRRAVATGFHDEMTEQEVENLLKKTIVEIGMSTGTFRSSGQPSRSQMHSYISLTVMKETSTPDQRTWQELVPSSVTSEVVTIR